MRATFIRNAHSTTITSRTVSGGDTGVSANFASGFGSLPTYTAYDVSYTYGNFFGGAITAGVKNVFNDNPPLDFTEFAPSSQLNFNAYDPLGRIFYANLDYVF